MSLSDYEIRVLDGIEQRLVDESPRLARRFTDATTPRQPLTIVASAAWLLVGLVLIVAGVRLGGWLGPLLGVVGYLVTVDACWQTARWLSPATLNNR